MINTISDFKLIFENIKNDVKNTRFRIVENANRELINLYFRLGNIIDDNWQYGNNFINELSLELKLEFPDMKGFSPRNLRRMRNFYIEYKDISNWPLAVANLPLTHNYILIEKVKNVNKRFWYAAKCLENGWSKTVLIHQIESDLYQRQKENPKLTNFNDKLSITQSKLAKEILKDPYVFELSNIKENVKEVDI